MKSINKQYLALLLIVGGVIAMPTQAAIIYQHDDGSGESSLGASVITTSIWLNAFQIVPGGEKITSIDIAFGPPSQSSEVNGEPITAYLWSDPTNDGDPRDAILEASVEGLTANVHTDIFNLFTLSTPLTFGVSDWFYAGFGWESETGSGAGFLVSRDTGSDAGASWFFSDVGGAAVTDPTDLGAGTDGVDNNSPADLAGFDLGGNFLIRANGMAGGSVPEPSIIALFAVGLFGLGFARRRKA